MKFPPLFQQLFFAFLMSIVWNTAVYGANLDAFWGGKPANAFSALGGVDFVYRCPFFYGLVLAFRLTGAAANAFIGDFVRHLLS